MIVRLIAGVLAGGTIGAMLGYFGKCDSGTCPLTANPFRGAVLGALLGALFSLSFGSRHSESAQRTLLSAASATNTAENVEAKLEPKQNVVMHVNNDTDFKKHVLEAKFPCLADFFSDSCPPCRMLAPTISTLAHKYKGKAVICKVSLDHAETRGLARQYRITIIPTVLFFEDGKETRRLVGLQSAEVYSKVIDQMIMRHSEAGKEE